MIYQIPSPAGWFALLAKIKADLSTLAEAEKQWLHDRIAAIEKLQLVLDD